jgi:hypothetical protein
MLLFDIGMIVGAAAIVITFISSVVSNTRGLYRAEPLPGSRAQGPGLRAQGLGLRAQGSGLRA